MKITMKKNLIFVLGLLLVMGFTACSSEIEDGTTDIDSWPMPYEEVKGEIVHILLFLIVLVLQNGL